MGEIHLLIVEGNKEIKNTLNVALCRNFSLISTSSGHNALRALNTHQINMAVIDLNIQDIEAREIVTKIKQIGAQTPIFVLTSNTELKHKIELFNLGADDVITKPFSLGELEARLLAHKKRLIALNNFDNILETSNLVLNKNKHEVTRDGYRTIELRKKEYAILEYLMMNPDKVITRNKLSSYVWSIDYRPWSNSLDVHIKNLRDKLDKPFKKQIIETVHGYGYRLVSDK